MDFTLLSGVVRNRKVAPSALLRPTDSSNEETDGSPIANSFISKMRNYFCVNRFFKKLSLRVHRFIFQWDLVLHLLVCIASLFPFFITGNRVYSLVPIGVWAFYNTLFFIGPKNANLVIPGFGRLKRSFSAMIEEFFYPKLLPVISISFLLIVLSLSVTGHRLGGPPLCYQTCGICLSRWSNGIKLDATKQLEPMDYSRIGCGYLNGKELLGYYTMAETSFSLFLTVLVAMAVCLAWRVADEEIEEQKLGEQWLKKENPKSYNIRYEINESLGKPASFVRPEGGPAWVFFGVVAALTFTLLGWHNWYVLPPSHTATLLIILNLLTILTSTLILHLGFFGRILSLYKRNFLRVQMLTESLKKTHESELDSWWNCRNFVLNEDLSLDYDIGGLAVSATFMINVLVFFILILQLYREGGIQAMLEPPGSYCAYACMYITTCLIKLFTLATHTYEEQHRHIVTLEVLSVGLSKGGKSQPSGNALKDKIKSDWIQEDDYNNIQDDSGPIDIDEESEGPTAPPSPSSPRYSLKLLSKYKGVASTVTPGSPGQSNFSSGQFSDNYDTQREDSVPLLTESMSGLLQLSLPDDIEQNSGSITHPSNNRSLLTQGLGNPSPRLVPPVSSFLSPRVAKGLSVPQLVRNSSITGTIEAYRSTIAEIISQIRKYDPYPCILGIPVMPALFTTCKFYIFISFVLIGTRTMIACLRQM